MMALRGQSYSGGYVGGGVIKSVILTIAALLLFGACGGGPTAVTSTATGEATPASVPTAVPSTPTSPAITNTPHPTPTRVSGGPTSAGMDVFLSVPENAAPQALWCYQCHYIDGLPEANGLVGPDLTNIGIDAANRKAGLSAEDYIRESIVDPESFICDADRCTAGLMTPAITENLTEEQVDALVAFLLTL